MPDQAAGTQPPKSIFDLEPLEQGGEVARRGLGFQDHIVAGLCIDALLDPSIKEIWCETHDDVMLLLETSSGFRIEFIQVKGNEFDQLWSIAKLVEVESTADGKRAGKCIIEKSLANDRCSEPCCFRIATARPINKDLEPLSFPRDGEARTKAATELSQLATKLGQKLASLRSPNNHDVVFWVQHTYWQVAHSLDSEKHRNVQRLHSVINGLGYLIAPDQLEEVYAKLVRKAWDAATAKFRNAPSEKKIKRDELIAWIRRTVDQMLHPAQAAGRRLESKMKRAILPEDVVKTALEQRSEYLREILQPKYLDIEERRQLESEISATLLVLRAKLDSGERSDNGLQFHSRCLQQIEALSTASQSSGRVPKSFLFGCMYNITDRCLHRFTQVEA